MDFIEAALLPILEPTLDQAPLAAIKHINTVPEGTIVSRLNSEGGSIVADEPPFSMLSQMLS